jgi:hypothetical protein
VSAAMAWRDRVTLRPRNRLRRSHPRYLMSIRGARRSLPSLEQSSGRAGRSCLIEQCGECIVGAQVPLGRDRVQTELRVTTLEGKPPRGTAPRPQEFRLVPQTPLAGGPVGDSPVSQAASVHRGGNDLPYGPLDAVPISKLPQGCSAPNEGSSSRSAPPHPNICRAADAPDRRRADALGFAMQ